MQQNTELLIVTVAQMQPEKETQALARVRMIIETLRSAVGLTTAHFYRGQNNIYVMFTTWEDKESWQKAQERHLLRALSIYQEAQRPEDMGLDPVLNGLAEIEIAREHLEMARIYLECSHAIRELAVGRNDPQTMA